MFLLNKIKMVDFKFFIIVVVIVAIAVAAYFLIPLLRTKYYKESRERLAEREEVYRARQQRMAEEKALAEAAKEEALKEENPKAPADSN